MVEIVNYLDLDFNIISFPIVVYVCRNPKDAAVSYFHHKRTFHSSEDTMDFEKLLNMFITGNATFGDYWFHLKVK